MKVPDRGRFIRPAVRHLVWPLLIFGSLAHAQTWNPPPTLLRHDCFDGRGPDNLPGTPDDAPGQFGLDGLPGTADDIIECKSGTVGPGCFNNGSLNCMGFFNDKAAAYSLDQTIDLPNCRVTSTVTNTSPAGFPACPEQACISSWTSPDLPMLDGAMQTAILAGNPALPGIPGIPVGLPITAIDGPGPAPGRTCRKITVAAVPGFNPDSPDRMDNLVPEDQLDVLIDVGFDLFQTPLAVFDLTAFGVPPIAFEGVPLAPSQLGDADMIVERFDPIGLRPDLPPQPIDIEIVALSLRSVEPIQIETEPPGTFWDIWILIDRDQQYLPANLFLQPPPRSLGSMEVSYLDPSFPTFRSCFGQPGDPEAACQDLGVQDGGLWAQVVAVPAGGQLQSGFPLANLFSGFPDPIRVAMGCPEPGCPWFTDPAVLPAGEPPLPAGGFYPGDPNVLPAPLNQPVILQDGPFPEQALTLPPFTPPSIAVPVLPPVLAVLTLLGMGLAGMRLVRRR